MVKPMQQFRSCHQFLYIPAVQGGDVLSTAAEAYLSLLWTTFDNITGEMPFDCLSTESISSSSGL